MKISLVTATLGRVSELENLFISLTKQTFQNFELILVDQNEHFLLEEMVSKYDQIITIKYIRSHKKGLSLNRNIGINHCKGDIIGFPDDDCFYNEFVLESVTNSFLNGNNTFVCVEAIDSLTNNIFIQTPNRTLNRKDVLKYCISYNVFLRFKSNIHFDEHLGVGTKFSSGEETDYVWSVLNDNDNGEFAKSALVYHPQNSSSNNLQRAYSYGLGFGAIFKKEFFRNKKVSTLLTFFKYVIRSIGGVVLSENKMFYIKTLEGRIKGFIDFKIK